MQANIDTMLTSQICGSLRIGHEYHGTCRGDGAMPDALENAVGGLGIYPPIICVDDENATCTHGLGVALPLNV
jgi:hypothetical protein